MKRGWLRKMAQVLLGGGLLVALSLRTDVSASRVADILLRLGATFPAIVLLDMLSTLITAVQWRQLARPLGIPLQFGRAVRLTFVGVFATNFLPTSLGGDLVKVALAPTGGAGHMPATVSVVAQRAMGFGTLLAIIGAGLGTGAFPHLSVRWQHSWLAVALAAAAIASAATVAAAWALGRRLVGRSLRSAAQALSAYRLLRWRLVGIAALSVLFYALALSVNRIGLAALGHHVAWPSLMVAVPLVYLVTALPVSINGIGLRETGYVYFLGLAGVPAADALGLSLALSASYLLVSALGGVLLLADRSTGSVTSSIARRLRRSRRGGM